MAEIVVLVGNIGSGKTTLARKYVEKGHILVGKDYMRTMIGGGKYIFDNNIEKLLNYITGAAIGVLLKHKYNVVYDECNTRLLERVELAQIATGLGAIAIAHSLPIYTKEEAVTKRMEADNRGYTKERWGEIYNEKLETYTKPSMQEGFAEIREGSDVN